MTFPGLEPSPQELKQALSMAYVCARLGITLDEAGRGLCPKHEADGLPHNPSLEVWEGDDGQRVHCHPCDFDADIIGLTREVRVCSFGQALDFLRRVLNELPPGYEQPSIRARPPARPEDWTAEIEEARQRAAQPGLGQLLSIRGGFTTPGDDPRTVEAWGNYLLSWGWGLTAEGTVLVPHWDPAGNLTGCHKRHSDGTKGAIKGSTFPHLYGAWRPRTTQRIFIAEGETDAIYVAYHAHLAGEPLDVYALPSGAQQDIPAAWLDFIKNARYLYLGFDPDEEGVKATRRWIEEFASQTSSTWEVRVCVLPLGRDIRSARSDIPQLLRSAKKPLPIPDEVVAAPPGYIRADARGNLRAVTSWTVDPVAQLAGGDEPGFDVILHHAGTEREAVLRLADMGSVTRLNTWANMQGLIFTGTDADRRSIADWVKARGHVTPEILQTSRVGLHMPPANYRAAGPTIVYPGGYDGDLPWRYAPTAHSADVSGEVYLPATADPDWSWLETYLQLSAPEVMHPLLAWLVAAMRRPEASEFPMLFIGGSSGVGKSTLARLSMRLAGSAIEVDLGTITPFILLRALSASTSLPVFVDEWTRHSRKDTREAFQGYVPTLYAGGLAERGQSDLSSIRYRLSSPTLVAGEDTFALDRERERIVTLHPTRDTQNPQALYAISGKPLQKIGAALHGWLATAPPDLPPINTPGRTRPEHNRDVLEAGWATLRAFCDHLLSQGLEPPNLPAVPNLSCFDEDPDEPEENVYVAALLVGLALTDGSHRPLVWRDATGRGTWVRAEELVASTERFSDIVLPGKSRALLSYFREQHTVSGGKPVRPPSGMGTVRAWLVEGLDLPEPEAEAGINPELPI